MIYIALGKAHRRFELENVVVRSIDGYKNVPFLHTKQHKPRSEKQAKGTFKYHMTPRERVRLNRQNTVIKGDGIQKNVI